MLQHRQRKSGVIAVVLARQTGRLIRTRCRGFISYIAAPVACGEHFFADPVIALNNGHIQPQVPRRNRSHQTRSPGPDNKNLMMG
ncbi:hypothetical protein D3C75_1056640 [compost metagenome]